MIESQQEYEKKAKVERDQKVYGPKMEARRAIEDRERQKSIEFTDSEHFEAIFREL